MSHPFMGAFGLSFYVSVSLFVAPIPPKRCAYRGGVSAICARSSCGVQKRDLREKSALFCVVRVDPQESKRG
ncbi:hypothetical protein [Rhodomicrobium lacus]|uniref:hypothetical protein n=1 Tax=Rhodomicrobium lacus TaxID=2498452 RepID=UPI0013E07C68|nr:hypothetical protein [Rhodomicrobium lacus]